MPISYHEVAREIAEIIIIDTEIKEEEKVTACFKIEKMVFFARVMIIVILVSACLSFCPEAALKQKKTFLITTFEEGRKLVDDTASKAKQSKAKRSAWK